MFEGCGTLNKIHFENINLNKVIDMSNIFKLCISLKVVLNKYLFPFVLQKKYS